MERPMLLGIDVGTTGVKAVLCTPDGEITASGWGEVTLHSPHPTWAEEDPEQWWTSTVAAVRQCLVAAGGAGRIAAVGVSGMAPALVLLDEDGRPVRRSIQQNDARAGVEIEELKLAVDQTELFRRTGGTVNQQTLGPKFRWIQRHEPETWSRVRHALGSYDFINYRLTGELAVERNWALESGLFDLERQTWLPWMLEAAGVDPEWLPPVKRPEEWVGSVSGEASRDTGIPAGTPVCAGSADHVASALSAGIVRPGDMLIKFGGAADILYALDVPQIDPRLFIDYHDIPGRYLLNGCMASSGSVVKWFVGNFCRSAEREAAQAGRSLYAYLDALAERIEPGADGLVVLPYFLGEKTPVFDVNARGVFAGLSLHHTAAHVYRAILEAVIYGFQHHIEVLGELGHVPRRVVATNGGAKSPLWRQIAADVLGLPVEYIQDHPGSSLGAAFVAGMAAGLFPEWGDVGRFVRVSDTVYPDESKCACYQEYYKMYRMLYGRLRGPFFDGMAVLPAAGRPE